MGLVLPGRTVTVHSEDVQPDDDRPARLEKLSWGRWQLVQEGTWTALQQMIGDLEPKLGVQYRIVTLRTDQTE